MKNQKVTIDIKSKEEVDEAVKHLIQMGRFIFDNQTGTYFETKCNMYVFRVPLHFASLKTIHLQSVRTRVFTAIREQLKVKLMEIRSVDL